MIILVQQPVINLFVCRNKTMQKIMTTQNNNQTGRNSIEKSRQNESVQVEANNLQKYRVVKIASSGDYYCHDQYGNNYLLVSQDQQGGVREFRTATKGNFYRSSTNRALITPFEDVIHDGVIFTVYLLPQRSLWLADAISLKSRAQIYCLSILYTLIKRALKPLLQIFAQQAQKWLHAENIWIKQGTIFYILNQRTKSQHKYINRTEQKVQRQFINETKQQTQKRLLRKLCNILTPHFKINPEMKSFLSTVMDAMLNQEFSISQICLLLNDKKKRKAFMQEKQQKQDFINQNQVMNNYETINNQIWSKRNSYHYSYVPKRGLKNSTMNIYIMRNEQKQIYERNLKQVGETIDVPQAFKSRRSSLSFTGMFNFKQILKKRNSLSSEKGRSRYKQSRQKGMTENIHQNMKEVLKTHTKDRERSIGYSININVKQRAHRKYREFTIQSDRPPMKIQNKSINEGQKILRAYFEQKQKSKQKSRKFQTIDISQLKSRPYIAKRVELQETNQQPIDHKKQLFVTQQKETQKQGNVARERKFSQNQVKIQQQKVRFQTDQSEKLKQQNEKQRMKKFQLQKQVERLKKIQRERQQQIQILKQREKERQKERQKQRLKQIEKQNERQKMKQIEIEKQKQKQREKQRNQRQLKQKKQKQQETKAAKNQKQLKKSQSEAIKNKNFMATQQYNLDQIEIVSPLMKQQLQKKKKQQEEKQNKNSKPPLPTSNIQRKNQGLAKNPSIDDQLQQIVLGNTAKNISISKDKIEPERPKSSQKRPSIDIKQQKKQKVDIESASRTKTVTSQIASSCGPKKPVSKQVAEYMHMINKMGEAVAKSSKVSSKLEGIEWFTGIYFIYKRFLFQRKKIQKWLQKKQPNLTRYNEKNKSEWEQWFSSEQKKQLQQKVKAENENIVTSIIKMNKKIMKKSLPGNFLFHAALSKHSEQQSKIAVSEVVKQYDDLDQKQKLGDDQILVHINQLLNSVYIIAQLDGKIQQKKPLMQILKKKNPEELSQFSDFIYDLYIKE